MCGLRPRDNVNEALINLHWLPVTGRIEFKLCVLVYKSLNVIAPSYIDDHHATCIHSSTTSGGSTGGARGAMAPLDWGQKNFIARPKNTHICKPPFACQNVLKLTYSNLEFQNFPGEDPRTPLINGRGGEGKGGEGGEREVKEGGER